MVYLFLVIGLLLLVKGADFFVDGASGIAKILKIPPILIGLTIVAFGTSSPEAAVSISAAIRGNSGIALGNVVGSNIFNISFIIGVTALIYPLKVEKETIKKEIPFTLLASIVLLILMSDRSLQSIEANSLTRSDGLVFIAFLSIFMYYIFEVAKHSRQRVEEDLTPLSGKALGRNILYTGGGLAAIISGGELVVRSSTNIAYALGMSQTLVGLTIVAVGTSLPELITSVTAALKKESEIAVGNIVGSNIFNILFILGASSVIYPVRVDEKVFTDAALMILYTIVLLIFSRTERKISKTEGGMLLVSYIAYTVYIIMRN